MASRRHNRPDRQHRRRLPHQQRGTGLERLDVPSFKEEWEVNIDTEGMRIAAENLERDVKGFASARFAAWKLRVAANDIDALRAEVEQLATEAQALHEDPWTIERALRQEGFLRPGEVVFEAAEAPRGT